MKKIFKNQFNLTSFYKRYLEHLYVANKINLKNLLKAAKLIEDTVKKITYMSVAMGDQLQ